jgi:hypothetical protein
MLVSMSVQVSREAIPGLPLEQLLPMSAAAKFVLDAPNGSVLALSGIDNPEA